MDSIAYTVVIDSCCETVEKRYHMINFDEEIAKFQPSLEVDQAEEVIFNNDLTDISDMIESILKEKRDK